MAAPLNPERWEPFTEHERALICVALCTHMVFTLNEGQTRERQAKEVLATAPLISELNILNGGEGVDQDLLARLQELVA